MIHSIHIKNFQSHKETWLELSPGLNVVSGQSRSGKSAVIRALNWAIGNRPQGFGFRRHKTPQKEATEVVLDMGDSKITRFRSSKDNAYFVDSEGEDALELRALRADVPDEVDSILNIPRSSMQFQLDSPFLLQDSPLEVSSKLNEVCGLEIIDACLKQAGTTINKTRTEVDRLSKNIEQTKETLKGYEGLDGMDEQLQVMERLHESIAEKAFRKDKLSVLAKQVKDSSQSVVEIDDWLQVEGEAGKLLSLKDRIKSRKEKIEKLSKLVSQLHACHKRLEESENKLAPERDVSEVLSVARRVVSKRQNTEALRKMIHAFHRCMESMSNMDRNITQKEEQYHILLEEYEVCPLCGNSIGDNE